MIAARIALLLALAALVAAFAAHARDNDRLGFTAEVLAVGALVLAVGGLVTS